LVNNWKSDPVDGRLALESHDRTTGSDVTSPTDTVIQDDEWHHLGITFGSSFGTISFGNVAQAGMSEQFLLGFK
jgi:hypothetical protein